MMLHSYRLSTSARLETIDLRRAMQALEASGFAPVILQAQRHLLRSVGIMNEIVAEPIESIRSPFVSEFAAREIAGDIFIVDDKIFYCVSLPYGLRRIATRFERYDPQSSTQEGSFIEVGCVSMTLDGLHDGVASFAAALQDAIMKSVDGRKTRYMNFDWRPENMEHPRLVHLTSGSEDVENRFQHVEMDHELIACAELLCDLAHREILREISQAGFARERDILSKRSRKHDEFKLVLDDLKKRGLIKSEFLIECKKHGTPLTKVENESMLGDATLSGLMCPSCGSPLSAEAHSEGFSIDDKGAKLIAKSHWLTVHVTSRLMSLGVASDAIIWNLYDGGEEVDIVIGLPGAIWIFELKDREFGAGDAYALNYRKVRYRAEKAIIVTADKVSKDAKRVFEELAREARSRRYTGDAGVPVYIEGLGQIIPALEAEISNRMLEQVCVKLDLLGTVLGFRLSAIIGAKFGALETVKTAAA